MAKKKSKAQIKRMQQRAEARGEKYEYIPPEPSSSAETESVKGTVAATSKKNDAAAGDGGNVNPTELKAHQAYQTYKKDLERIEGDETLKSKERRSGKRKAEAIALEAVKEISSNDDNDDANNANKISSITTIEDFQKWHDDFIQRNPQVTKKSKREKKAKDEVGQKKTPYIAFFGQLSFETTKESLNDYIHQELEKQHCKNIKIRMLTNPKTKSSRGMAFVETDTPESLYALLKLHQTFLEGRRLNVERSAGGGRETRKGKIQQFREEQEAYFANVIENILQEFKKNGELRDDELDEGVIGLCKRHSATVVQAALTRYIEGNGRDMDNPSAFLSHLITKFAEEGIYESTRNEQQNQYKSRKRNDNASSSNNHNKKRPKKDGNDDNNNNNVDGENMEDAPKATTSSHKKFKISSEFGKAGVDMSISQKSNDETSLTKIFPSARRGRGRGYM